MTDTTKAYKTAIDNRSAAIDKFVAAELSRREKTKLNDQLTANNVVQKALDKLIAAESAYQDALNALPDAELRKAHPNAAVCVEAAPRDKSKLAPTTAKSD